MRSFAVLIAALLAAAALAASAGASSGPCRDDGTGPGCHFWTAKAKWVNDGDTIGVDIDGDRTHHVYAVRFTGLQAMELTRHNNAHPSRWRGCNGVEAARFVLKMVRRSHWRVRISAIHPDSHADVRLQRAISVKVGGRWQDLGAMEMARGLTLFMGSGREWAWNATYNQLGQQARLQGLGMWNPAHCGSGPQQQVPIKVWANWDPPGNDLANLNGELIKIQNQSPSEPLNLGRWWVRDSMLRRFTFPAGTTVPPGRTLTVHTGSGTPTATDLYWGLHQTLFDNIDGVGLGDGAYLFDPQGDLRQAMVYPCLVACTDPLQNAVSITAHPRGHEYATVRNVSGGPVDLYGYGLQMPNAIIPFDEGTVLQPGQAIEVDAPSWHGGPLLPDRGGNVRVVTFSDITVACDSWGDGRC